MKKYFPSLLLLLFFVVNMLIFGDNQSPIAQQLCIGSYNIRRKGKESRSVFKWKNRANLVFRLIGDIGYDVVGLQEATRKQIQDISVAFPEYGWIGQSRRFHVAGGTWQKFVTKRTPDEYNPLFYNRKRVNLLSFGTFGINPRAKRKIATLARICTWGLFQDKITHQRFYVYNTHLDCDADNNEMRIAQIKLVIADIKKRTLDLPVILMGDLNTPLTGKMLSEIERTGFMLAKKMAQTVEGPQETRTGWNNSELKTIDHMVIYAPQAALQVAQYAVVPSATGVFPSDHRPIYAMVNIS